MEKVILKMVKLYENAKLPKKAHLQDAGWDVFAYIPEKEIKIYPHETLKIHTGFSAAVPVGYFGTFMARSGLATKEGLRPANTIPVVDVGYTGEWVAAIHNDSDEARIIKNGDRICQMMLIPIPEIEIEMVDSLDETERGTTGFGDSGKR